MYQLAVEVDVEEYKMRVVASVHSASHPHSVKAFDKLEKTTRQFYHCEAYLRVGLSIYL